MKGLRLLPALHLLHPFKKVYLNKEIEIYVLANNAKILNI